MRKPRRTVVLMRCDGPSGHPADGLTDVGDGGEPADDAGCLQGKGNGAGAAEQPPANSAGLPDDRLVALGRQVGAGEEFARCLRDERYAGWTRSVTDAAPRKPGSPAFPPCS